jgi:hypothetical protein
VGPAGWLGAPELAAAVALCVDGIELVDVVAGDGVEVEVDGL